MSANQRKSTAKPTKTSKQIFQKKDITPMKMIAFYEMSGRREYQSGSAAMAIEDKEIAEKVRKERNLLLVERERLFRRAEEIEARGKIIERKLQDCIAAARLFGLTLALPDWDRVLKTSLEEEMNRLMNSGRWVRPEPTADIPYDEEEVLKEILEGNADADEAESRPADMPSIRDIVLARLEEASDAGSKASAIREFIETTYAANIHVKTVGMTLYRLLKEGIARRDGRTWFRISPPQQTVITDAFVDDDPVDDGSAARSSEPSK